MNPQRLEDLFASWRGGDADGAVALFTEDGIFKEAGKPPLEGRATLLEHWKPFFSSGREFRFDVDELFGDAAGERFAVAYRWSMRGSDGTWKERPGCALVRARGDAIAEWREYSG